MAKFELTRISNRVRFILAVISGEMVISNRKRADIEAQLESDGYDRMPNTKKVLHAWRRHVCVRAQVCVCGGGRGAYAPSEFLLWPL